MAENSLKGQKALWEKVKLLITSNFSFSQCFQVTCTETHENLGLFGKGLSQVSPSQPPAQIAQTDIYGSMMLCRCIKPLSRITWHRYKCLSVTSQTVLFFCRVAINYMEYYEHIGTHIDAPIHTAEGRSTLEQIPAYKLMGPGVVFDIKQKAQQNPDYGLTVADIEEYEAEFGRIPDDAIVVINTGWGLKFPRPDQIFGTEILNDSTTFHYPGYTVEAAKFLLTKRSVLVVGSDTPSVDLGIEHKLKVHVYLQSHEVPLMEYVANLDKIPQNGTTIFLGAPKFRGGTGGPTRALAVIEDDFYVHASSCNICLPFLNLVKSCLLGAFIIAIIRM